jgi:prepilin-type N-terminal cleavage/methylation domain-containing protein
MQQLLAKRARPRMAHQPGRGLSLVELLMVIAIIALVFGILMVILDKTIHVVRSFGH